MKYKLFILLLTTFTSQGFAQIFLPTQGCLPNPGITRQTYGVVADVTGWLQRASDMTLFESVWGYTPGQSLIPFPGRINKQERPYIEKNKYIALKFTVPTHIKMGSYSYFSFGETNPESKYTMTISAYCGDFRDPSLSKMPGCSVSGITPSGTLLWGVFSPTMSVSPKVCQLQPGRTYYLNIIQAPINDLTKSYCKKSSCGNSIQNGPASISYN